MGFLSGIFGGGAKKTKASNNEKALGQVSREQAKRYLGTYVPLRRDLEDMADTNYDDTLRGRANADVMQSLGTPRASPSPAQRLNSVETLGSNALAKSMTGGTREATRLQDNRTQAAIGVGQGDAGAAVQGLGAAASATSSKAISQMQLDNQKYLNNVDMFTSLAGAGAGAYAGMSSKKPQLGSPNMQGQSKALTNNPAFVKNY